MYGDLLFIYERSRRNLTSCFELCKRVNIQHLAGNSICNSHKFVYFVNYLPISSWNMCSCGYFKYVLNIFIVGDKLSVASAIPI
jgi:hypothetical protein